MQFFASHRNAKRVHIDIKFMYSRCIANADKRSTKWLPENMLFVVCFGEIVISEDYRYDRNLRVTFCEFQIYAVTFALDVVAQCYCNSHIFPLSC